MANRFSAAFQSFTGTVHFFLLRSASRNILKAASSSGKARLALVTLRKLRLSDSMR